MTFSLPLHDAPMRVQERHQCWSAAYESWTVACARIIPAAFAVSEDTIEGQLSRYPNALDANGAATIAGIGLLTHTGELHLEAIRGDQLTAEVLVDRLTRYGYIYLVFWGHGRHGLFSHAVVVSNARGRRMRVMDPGPGRGLITQPVTYYRHAVVMFLGTHKLAHSS